MSDPSEEISCAYRDRIFSKFHLYKSEMGRGCVKDYVKDVPDAAVPLTGMKCE